MAARENEHYLRKAELVALFEGKTMLEIAPLIVTKHAEMLLAEFTVYEADELLAYVVASTNRPCKPIGDLPAPPAPPVGP